MASIPNLFNSMVYEDKNLSNFTAAESWLKSANGTFGSYIDGKWVIDSSEKCHTFYHPLDSSNTLAKVYPTSLKSIDDVKQWASTYTTPKQPDKVYQFLLNVSGILEKNANLFAQVEIINRKLLMRNVLNIDVVEMMKYFKYYSSFAFKDVKVNEKWKPELVTLGVMSRSTPLVEVAWLLAPAFATQSHVIIYVPCEIALSIMLFVSMCVEGTEFSSLVSVLPGNADTLKALVTCKEFSNIVCLGNKSVTNSIKETAIIGNLNKKFTSLHYGNSSMVIFSSGDIDSAADCVVNSICQNQRIYPWTVKNLIVEESISKRFCVKLENRIMKLNSGHICYQSTDIGPLFEGNDVTPTADVVRDLRRNGVEVCHLTLGGDSSSALHTNPSVVVTGINGQGGDTPASMLHISTFRTAREAVSLVNKSLFRWSVSVWTHNLPVALSVVNQLQVGTVWINNHGLFDPAVPIQDWSESEIGEFGGLTGLIKMFRGEFDDNKEGGQVGESATLPKPLIGKSYKLYYGGSYKNGHGNNDIVIHETSTIKEADRHDVEASVEAALLAQASWRHAGQQGRAHCLFKMADSLKKQQEALESVVGCSLDWLIEEICNSTSTLPDSVVRVGEAMVTVSREPLGVIALVFSQCDLAVMFRVLLLALSYGNTVVVVLEGVTSLPALEVFKAVVEVIPPGMLNILTGFADKLLTNLIKNTSVNYIWYPSSPEVELRMEKVCLPYNKEFCCWNNPGVSAITQKVARIKSIWMTGEIGIC